MNMRAHSFAPVPGAGQSLAGPLVSPEVQSLHISKMLTVLKKVARARFCPLLLVLLLSLSLSSLWLPCVWKYRWSSHIELFARFRCTRPRSFQLPRSCINVSALRARHKSLFGSDTITEPQLSELLQAEVRNARQTPLCPS